VILSYSLWQRHFYGDRNVLGKQLKLDGEAYSVVGGMPSTFKFAPFWATKAELWVPDTMADTRYKRNGNHLRVFARLKPGVTLDQARADMATVTGRLDKQYPATNRNVVVRPLKENVVGNIETPLLMILGSVGLVLLIACANVAHMLLARTSDRQKEIAVRVAVGAGKGRLMAQFFTENLLLAGAGAGAGLLLALAGIKSLVALSPDYLPRVQTVSLDSKVLGFLSLITVLTALLFGLTPAMHAASANLSDALKEGGRGDSDGKFRNRLRSFLVSSEFALAFMLLIGAGLMVRSFYALQAVDTGFNPHHVLSMVVSVAGTTEAQPGRREEFYRGMLQKIKGLPGVDAAGAINHIPLVGDVWDRNLEIEGRPKARPGQAPDAVYRIVLPGYFDTMRLPLEKGRAITYQDNSNAPAVVMINQETVRRFWPGEDPIGKRFSLDNDASGKPEWLTIVGVVANASIDDMVSDAYPEMYLPALQTPAFMGDPSNPLTPHMSYITLVVRGNEDASQLTQEVERAVRSFDRNLPISQIVTMDEAVASATAAPRFEMLLLGLFGAVALILAAVGIYGVMNYSVARRTREIGIRMSLGASRTDVFRMVIAQAVQQALMGAACGIAGAVLLSKLMAKLVFGVRPTDPLTFFAVFIALSMAAVLASALPARKAIRIEPMNALRSE
jgi:predicted permease